MTAEREQWAIIIDFVGTRDEADRFLGWLGDEIPTEFVPTGTGSCGMDGASMRRIDNEVWDDR